MNSVLQPWVMQLPLAMQGTLLGAVRGPDNQPKETLAKEFTRAFRAAIMNNAHEKGTPGDDFMGDYSGWVQATHALHVTQPGNDADPIIAFRRDHDQYPHHWLMHLVHAAQIIGNYHPNSNIRGFWWRFYEQMCGTFHMNLETREQQLERLRSKSKNEKVGV